MLKKITFETPFGTMLAISDEHTLHLLEFVTRKNLSAHIKRLLNRTHQQLDTASPTSHTPEPLRTIQHEIKAYFDGHLTHFKTPITRYGTPFQKKTWDALMRIPYGETISYLEQAQMMQQPEAVRAVANANSLNQFALLVPCHRVIRSDHTLGGYAAGLTCKASLLQHEQRFKP